MTVNKAIAVQEFFTDKPFTLYHFENCKVEFFYGRRRYKRDLWTSGSKCAGNVRYWVRFEGDYYEVELYSPNPYDGCPGVMHYLGAGARKVNC